MTSGVAAPAYAGIPVTHRDDAGAVAFVTGHEDPAKEESAIDWEALARFPGTLVLYMGVGRAAEIASALIDAGRDPAEPAAAVERGTLPGQRTVVSHPRRAGRRNRGRRPAPAGDPPGGSGCRRAPTPSPGSSADLFTASAWSSPAPGLRRAAWRQRSPDWARTWSSFRRSASSLGSRARRCARPWPSLHTYALVCLTSPNAVRLLFEAMAAQGRDARALANATVAAIGPGTAAALLEHGVIADVVPERFVAEALVEALAAVDVAGKPVLVARAAEAREVLPEALRERGAEVDVVALYETVARGPRARGRSRPRWRPTTSPSPPRPPSATCMAVLDDRFPERARVVSIGPVTSETAREAGLEVHVGGRTPRPGWARRGAPRRRGIRVGRWPRRRSPSSPTTGTTTSSRASASAVIARIAPDARVIDLTHGIPRHAVAEGALVLARALPYTPAGVHLAVVDPGVGTDRRGIAVAAGEEGRILVGPDNGLLTPAAERLGGAAEAVDISLSEFRLEPVSATFHGRDLFAPVAAHLAAGAALADAGEPIDPASLAPSPLPSPGLDGAGATAHVVGVDRFGNVALDVEHEHLPRTGLRLGHPVVVSAGGAEHGGCLHAHLRRRRAGRADRLRGLLAAPSRWR